MFLGIYHPPDLVMITVYTCMNCWWGDEVHFPKLLQCLRAFKPGECVVLKGVCFSNVGNVFASLSVREKRSPSPSASPTPAAPSPQPASPVNTESESAPVSSDLSATVTANECVSEGQWVVNVLSEGEVPDLEANERKHLQILTVT